MRVGIRTERKRPPFADQLFNLRGRAARQCPRIASHQLEHRDLSVGKIKFALLLGVIALLEQQVHNDYGKETLYVVAGERGPCIKVSSTR